MIFTYPNNGMQVHITDMSVAASAHIVNGYRAIVAAIKIDKAEE